MNMNLSISLFWRCRTLTGDNGSAVSQHLPLKPKYQMTVPHRDNRKKLYRVYEFSCVTACGVFLDEEKNPMGMVCPMQNSELDLVVQSNLTAPSHHHQDGKMSPTVSAL